MLWLASSLSQISQRPFQQWMNNKSSLKISVWRSKIRKQRKKYSFCRFQQKGHQQFPMITNMNQLKMKMMMNYQRGKQKRLYRWNRKNLCKKSMFNDNIISNKIQMSKVIPFQENKQREAQNPTKMTNATIKFPNNLEISSEGLEESFPKNQKICQICFERNPQHILARCNHSFCKECLINYIEQKLKKQQKITCCFAMCDSQITTKYQKNEAYIYGHLPSKTKKKVKQNLKFHQSLRSPKKICSYCFKNKLKGQCHCSQNQIDLPQFVKKCQKCKKFIQKQKGCNHMKCSCGNQFCFDCGDPWSKNHICEYRIPERQGLSFVCCWIFKVFFAILLFPFIFAIYAFLALAISFISGIFLGFILFIKGIQLTKQVQNSCCKLLILLILLLFLPIIWASMILPGLFLPFINLCWKKQIFLDPSLLLDLAEQSFGCIYLIKLI